MNATDLYDPFVRGPFPVGVRTIEAQDNQRRRTFPCEVWYPAASNYKKQDLAVETQDTFGADHKEQKQMAIRNAAAFSGTYPLVLFSHHSGGHRRAATYLTTHLSSHGYIVAALDHSEIVSNEFAPHAVESNDQKAKRIEALISSRVPDIQFLRNYIVNHWKNTGADIEPKAIGAIGHSFGGWTVLSATELETSIRAVVALAPGGNSNPKPGILRAKLEFNWSRNVPTLYVAAENDTMIPAEGVREIFDRTPATKQMIILRKSDHLHFIDNVEEMHESVRSLPFSGDLAWIPREMRPIHELCPGETAHLLVRALAVAHMDAVLKQKKIAQRFLSDDLAAELAAHGIDAIVHK